MIHYLDIPKTTKSEEGIIRCIARNMNGEVESTAHLKINPKADYRSVLRSVKTGEPVVAEVEEATTRDERSKLTILN